MDGEDEILIMGYLLMKMKMRNRRNHQQRKQWIRELFLQRKSYGVYMMKELRLKDYCDILFCSFVLHLRWKMSLKIFLEYKCKVHVGADLGLPQHPRWSALRTSLLWDYSFFWKSHCQFHLIYANFKQSNLRKTWLRLPSNQYKNL